MRLQVTLLLLLGLFLKEFCLGFYSNDDNNVCDMKIKDFNTYEISCTKDKYNNSYSTVVKINNTGIRVESNNTESGNQDQESGSLCCQLRKEVVIPNHDNPNGPTTVDNHVKFAWGRGEDECTVPESVSEIDFFKKMVQNSFIEGNTCTAILKSNIEESESKNR